MSRWIKPPKLYVAGGNFIYEFEIQTGETTGPVEGNIFITEHGQFEFGSDDALDEFKLKAGSTDITLWCGYSDRFEPVVWYLRSNVTVCTVKLNGMTLFTGIVDIETLQPDYINYTIKMTVADGFACDKKLTLDDIVSIGQTIGYPSDEPNYMKRGISLVRLISRLTCEFLGIPIVSYGQKTRIKYKYNYSDIYTEADTALAVDGLGLLSIAGWYANLLSPNLYDNDPKKIIQACCNMLCSYAIMGRYRKLYILPIYYRGKNDGYSTDQDIITIKTSDLLESPESTFYPQTKKYIKWNVATYMEALESSNNKWITGMWNVSGMSQDDIDKIDSDEIKELFYPVSGVKSEEAPPIAQQDDSRTFLHLQRNGGRYELYPVKNDSVQFWDNGQFGEVKGLREECTNYLWDCINRPKEGFKIKVAGTEYDVFNIFSIPCSTKLYKVKDIIFNYVENYTEIELIECVILNRWNNPSGVPVSGTVIETPVTQVIGKAASRSETQPETGIDYLTESNYKLGTTKVYLNGLRQKLGLDYEEMGGKIIEFTGTIPVADDNVIVDYDLA